MEMENIFEGLKSATEKGESLQSAMISFFNAGYRKEDIEEAARKLQMEKYNQASSQSQQSSAPQKNMVQNKIPMQQTKIPQPVSGYGEESTPPKKVDLKLIILISLGIVVLAAIAALVLFR